MPEQPYRILSLDGGGAWAVLQVMALADMYGPETPGRQLLKQFDMVAATSGGAIVLMGLVENRTLGEIERIFSDKRERKKIFRRLPWWRRWLRLGVLLRIFDLGSRYSSVGKLKGLEALAVNTRDHRLDELPGIFADLPDLLITSFDYDRSRAALHRSNPKSAAAPQPPVGRPRLHEAVHASSAAPVMFFDEPAMVDGLRFWDGAIGGNNNPALLALVEALANGIDRSRIELLSIGTGSIRVFAVPPVIEPATTLGDIKKMATSVLDDPPDAATFHSHIVVGGRTPTAGEQVADGKVVRMSPVLRYTKDESGQLTRIPPGLSQEEFSALQDIDMDAVKPAEFDLVKKFGELWLTDEMPNQSIRSNRIFECEIGHVTYSEARQRWLDLLPKV